jgi:hypothetical protein
MPENRTVLFCASGVIVAGLAAQLMTPRCAIEQAAAETRVTDPTWGPILNLTVTPTQDGDRFEATTANGIHRIVQSAKVAEPGRYRLSIDTQLDVTPTFAIEISGPNQPYAFVVANLRTGKIESISGSGVGAGSEPLGPGRFRWWIDQNYAPGEVGYDFAIINWGNAPTFPGQGACRVILSNPGFRAVKQ